MSSPDLRHFGNPVVLRKEEVIPGGAITKFVLKEGAGGLPKYKDVVVAHYTGRVLDSAEVFDSSLNRPSGPKPFQFMIGIAQVIAGWDKGIATMKAGERAILLCSPENAYGEEGSPPVIPGNATLLFEVVLLGVG